MSSNKKSSSSGKSSSSATAKESSASPSTVKSYKPDYREMLSYGHKPGDSDWGEWREAYGKAFAKADRQAARDEQRSASSGKK